MFDFFKLLTESNSELKTIKDLDILDDVWVEENGEIRQAWIFEKTRKHISIVYCDDCSDYKFQIFKPFNVTEFKENNKILYCNKPN